MNVAPHLRTTLLSDEYVTSRLSSFNGDPAIYTRRPPPEDAVYPMIIIGPDVAAGDEDGINDFRPVFTRDIMVYGEQARDYRIVDEVAHRLYMLFHRRRENIVPDHEDWHTVGVAATTPRPAPTDDNKLVARMVSLQIKLARPSYLSYPVPDEVSEDDWSAWAVLVV